jgi:putative aminopeptidase FrvX
MAKKILNAESITFLEKYINNPSPTGFESEGQKLWLEYISPYVDTHFIDTYGTAVGVINPDAKFKVVVESHCDEISWLVNHISDKGYIHVVKNGGADHHIAPGKRVNIHGEKGIVKGIFGWPAIHYRTSETTPKPDNIFIDLGCSSKDEVLGLGVEVGSVITYEDEFMILNDKFFVGRALDNRIGGYMIAQVAKMLKDNDTYLDFGLYFVNSVQEETGLAGAIMIANNIKPDVAIITDVCHDTSTPLATPQKSGDTKCGLGPVLTVAPAVQNNLLKLIKNTAKEHSIPFQMKASSRTTGTDTDSFAYSGSGVASALISLPLKYMHTTCETVNKKDVKNCIKLIYQTHLNIKNGHDFRYFK